MHKVIAWNAPERTRTVTHLEHRIQAPSKDQYLLTTLKNILTGSAG